MFTRSFAIMLLVSASLFLWQSVSAQSSAQLNLGFFTDNTCSTRSTITPNASLGISVCAATLGALSIYVPTYPCSGTNVRLIGYSDTKCGTTTSDYFGDSSTGCYEFFGGSFGSILLACFAASDTNPSPAIASYTTINVGPLAVDATGAATGSIPTGTSSSSGSSGGSSSSSGGSTSSSSGSSGGSTGTSIQSSSSSSAATSAASSNNQSSSGSFDSLPIGAKVGIIVGAIVAGAIIIFLVWCMVVRERRHSRDHQIAMQQYEQSVYRPTTYPPSSGMALQSPPVASQGYAQSRYPLSDVDWERENNRSRYMGSDLGSADIEEWRDKAHTVTAHTQH